MTTAPPVLEVKDLTRRFGGVTAVDNVSFAVAPGEIFGLIGPNGAGKTTLFNVVTGITKPTAGRFLHDGEDVTGTRPHKVAARGIARTFQNIRLFTNLSALENVMIGRHLHTKSGLFTGVLGLPPGPAEERAVRERARELLDLMGLANRAGVKARNLPYGDQRRLEIARALALEPKVLLLDEPAAGMNPHEKSALSDFIRRLRGDFDLTVLLIEHHVPLVMGLCDRIAVLDFGKLIAHHVPLVMGLCDRIAVLDFGKLIALGDPEVVRTDPAVVEAYLGEE